MLQRKSKFHTCFTIAREACKTQQKSQAVTALHMFNATPWNSFSESALTVIQCDPYGWQVATKKQCKPCWDLVLRGLYLPHIPWMVVPVCSWLSSRMLQLSWVSGWTVPPLDPSQVVFFRKVIFVYVKYSTVFWFPSIFLIPYPTPMIWNTFAGVICCVVYHTFKPLNPRRSQGGNMSSASDRRNPPFHIFQSQPAQRFHWLCPLCMWPRPQLAESCSTNKT